MCIVRCLTFKKRVTIGKVGPYGVLYL